MKEIPNEVALMWFGIFFFIALILIVITVVIAVKIDKTFKENKRKVDEWNEEIPEDYYLKYLQMRELKFKAFNLETKSMYWFDLMWGSKHGSGSGWIAMLPIEEKERNYGNDNRITVDPEDCELMQFTGLKDTNGKDIYEGDLLKYSYARDMSGKDIIEFTEVVEWENTTDIVGFGIHQTMDHKIIGNIYEHPELLNSEQEAERSVATKMPNEQ